MLFSTFCSRKESDGLFDSEYENFWAHMPYIHGERWTDTFSMYIMGGEL